jgi:hypothetical protein
MSQTNYYCSNCRNRASSKKRHIQPASSLAQKFLVNTTHTHYDNTTRTQQIQNKKPVISPSTSSLGNCGLDATLQTIRRDPPCCRDEFAAALAFQTRGGDRVTGERFDRRGSAGPDGPMREEGYLTAAMGGGAV